MKVFIIFNEEKDLNSNIPSPIQVGEDTVKIRNYGIQSPVGYRVGLVINEEEIAQIQTGNKEFMELVGREATWKKKHIFSRKYQLQSFTNIDKDEFFRQLSIWATIEYNNYKSKKQESYTTMLYRENFVKLQVKNIVDLFDMNDKSKITIISQDSSDVLFKDRVDYLQYTMEGVMSQLCSLEIESLEVNGGEFIIYVEKG